MILSDVLVQAESLTTSLLYCNPRRDRLSHTRYAKVNERLDEINKKLRSPPTDTEFNHHEWLLCERESLILERDQIEVVMKGDGTVDYD